MKEENLNTRIQTAISRELVHLDNMRHRILILSNCTAHQSYINRIVLQIEYVEKALKEYRTRLEYEKLVEEVVKNEREDSSLGPRTEAHSRDS